MVLIGSIYYTFAYFNKEEVTQLVVTTGDVNLVADIRFDDVIVDDLSPYFDQENQMIIINASDSESINALSKLIINLIIETDYASRFRIKLKESYIKERTYFSTGESLTEVLAMTENRVGHHPFSNLAYGETYQMIHGDEGFQYYPEIMNENTYLTLPVVNGGLTIYGRTNQQFVETITLKLQIIIDVVQANRYQEIWGIDQTIFQ